MKITSHIHFMGLLPGRGGNIKAPPAQTEPLRVAVVDYFDGKTTDVDGDGIPDISHGEMVRRLIGSLLPQVQTVAFPLPGPPDHIDPRHVAKQIRTIIKRLAKGERFDAINLSIATLVNKNDVPGSALPPLRLGIPHWLRGKRRSHPFQYRALKAIRRIEQVAARGVPVYIGGGNDGPGYLNLYGLAKGAVSVGATNARQEKAHYSANNQSINRWSQGTYNVSKVPGGYDLTGLGTAMVSDEEVSGGPKKILAWAAPFIGKPLQAVLVSDVELSAMDEALKRHRANPEKLELLGKRIFPLDRLLQLGWVDGETHRQYKEIGEYAVIQGGRIKGALRVNQAGFVLYSPDGSNRGQALHYLYGTSLAAPTALCEDLGGKIPASSIKPAGA